MSTLERRLQLLLSRDQYDRVAAESVRRGVSVNAVVREALEEHLDSSLARRSAGLRDFIALSRSRRPAMTSSTRSTDYATIKAELEADHDRELLKGLGP